jgi:hypothetical protein
MVNGGLMGETWCKMPSWRARRGLEPERSLASPMPASWNHITTWLERIDELRRAA